MSYVKWKVDKYAFNNNTWAAVATEFTEGTDFMVSVKLGDGKDSFSFKTINFNGEYDDYFNPNDKVVISRVVNTETVTTNDVLMVGVIGAIPNDSAGNRNTLRIEGYNFSEAVMSSIAFSDIVDKTPPEAIQQALSEVSLNNSNFAVTWYPDNPTTKNNTTAFPIYSQRYFYVPLRKLIEEFSSQTRTEDGAYNWWVNTSNQLVWKHMDTGTTRDFNALTDELITYKDSKDTSKVRNFIILKGGSDPAGKSIQTVYQDFTSIAKHGMKYFFAVSQTVAGEDLNRQDIPDPNAPSRFPTAYPFTTNWNKISTNAPVVVLNDDEYVEAIRAEVKDLLKIEAEKITYTTRYGKLKVDLGFIAGSKNWVLGDKVNCVIPRVSSTAKLLRVVEIQYTSDSDIFSLEEDVGSI